MTDKTENSYLTQTEKYYLSRFLHERYGFPMMEAEERVNEEYSPDEDWSELPFTQSRLFPRSVDHDFSEEFTSFAMLLDEIIYTHLRSRLGNKQEFISQAEVPADKEYKLRENPNLCFTSYMPDEEVQELNQRLKECVDKLLLLLEDEDLQEETDALFKQIFSVYLYVLDNNETFTHVQNIHSVFQKSTNPFYEVSDRDVEMGYRSLGSKLRLIFDDEERIADELIEYYPGSVTELVKTTEKALEADVA